jgi:excinuclease ABC subunit B
MRRAIEETRRRRQMQEEYNRRHGITPETIRKAIHAGIEADAAAHATPYAAVGRGEPVEYITEEFLEELQAEMLAAAEGLEFERAAALRDRIQQMRAQMGKPVAEAKIEHATRDRRGRRHQRAPGPSGGRIPKPRKGV